VQDLSRSHDLTFVALPDGPAYVVKRLSRDASASGRSLAAELYTYRLASWRPELAAVLPRAVHLDERRQVLALVAAPPTHLYPEQCLRPGFPSPDLAAALGRSLAALHRATDGIPLLTEASCGVVHLPDTAEQDRRIGAGAPAALAVARAVVDDVVLAGALRRAAAALRPSCLIHADLKWDNAVLDPGPPARVTLFDWELSGRGDPAWDVGSALADTVSLPVRLGAAATPPPERLSPALRALLAAYGADGTGAGTEDFAERVVVSWAARTVHLALECGAAVEDPEHAVVRGLTATARRLVAAADALVPTVRAALAVAS
jgi:aminoglycoside phosphotransferase (APT) family kinase protein